MSSYSQETKSCLLEIREKKKCCGRMLDDVVGLQKKSADESLRIVLASPTHFKCPSCFSAFLRGIFISFGNVTDPSKSYHLELSFPTAALRDAVRDIIFENGFEMTAGQRGKRFLLYIKSSGKIEDFFALIGANKSVFDLMNSKIVKELKEQTNRQLNCDMANIRKTLSSVQPYTDAIELLKESGAVIRLSKELRETAEIRVKYPQASMAELALLHTPPISKSGVKHRLDKIKETAQAVECELKKSDGREE